MLEGQNIEIEDPVSKNEAVQPSSVEAEKKKLDPFKRVIQKLPDSPLAPPETRVLREQFEQEAEAKIKRFEEEFPDMEMVIGLAGSVQVGLGEAHDVDDIVFVRMKEGGLFRELENDQERERIESYKSKSQSYIYDFEELKQPYGEHVIGEPLWEDPNFDWWHSGPEGAKQERYLTELRERVYPEVFPLTVLFAYTSKAQEESGVVDRWRKELVEVISQRPDRETFWEYVVQPAWRLQFVLVEQREEIERIFGKRYARRVEKTISQAMQKRRKEKGRKLLTPEETERVIGHLEEMRARTCLPDLPTMMEIYGVEQETNT